MVSEYWNEALIVLLVVCCSIYLLRQFVRGELVDPWQNDDRGPL